MKLLEGKVAIITGASRGIGSGIAKIFAQHGAQVAFTYSSSAESALALEKELLAFGSKAKGYQSNAANYEEAHQLVDDVITDFGTVDILINNAGITKDMLLLRMKEEEWDDVMSTNLKSIFRMSQALIRSMMKSRYGRIINITSVVGHMGNAGQTNYAAAKAGVTGFTKSLAKEIGSRGITVNCVAPGFIDTDMTKGLSDEHKKQLLDHVPLGRLGSPEDIGAAVSFLASKEASYITGETLHVNGGMLMI